MDREPAVHGQRLIVAAVSSGLVALLGFGFGFFTTLLALGVMAVLSIACWVAIRPAPSTGLDGMLATGLAGLGPAVALGRWWYLWSDFCIFDCEGVARDPMAFVWWFGGTLAVSIAAGAAAGYAGARLQKRVVPAA